MSFLDNYLFQQQINNRSNILPNKPPNKLEIYLGFSIIKNKYNNISDIYFTEHKYIFHYGQQRTTKIVSNYFTTIKMNIIMKSLGNFLNLAPYINNITTISDILQNKYYEKTNKKTTIELVGNTIIVNLLLD